MSPVPALPPVRRDDAVTPETFVTRILPEGRPVLMKGLLDAWPAVKLGRTSPLAVGQYLKTFDRGNPATVLEANAAVKGRFAYGPDMYDFNFHRRTKSISAAIDQLLAAMDHPNPPYTYIQSTPIADHLPGFLADNIHPLVPPAIPPRIWISNATRAQTHNDHDHNLACVVAGHRRFTLFPPEQVKNLYIGPLDHTPSGRAISLASLEDPDFDKFPRFRDALATAEVAEMAPGDVLYVPKYWWHHVQSLDPFNVLVNYWWGNSADTLENPMAAFLAGLTALKGISPADKSYWKAIFDYYIFETDGDPVAHIPPAHRSALGASTPKLRAELIKQLKKLAAGS
ncbi:MAG: cupin-like domain-containing protein [Asticcacaulis sp.]|nr:cupin-like domain-containing protein [Asticcacaulis sp.]